MQTDKQTKEKFDYYEFLQQPVIRGFKIQIYLLSEDSCSCLAALIKKIILISNFFFLNWFPLEDDIDRF